MSSVMPVEIQPGMLRPLAYRTLSKKHGLNIQSDGLKELAKYIGTKFGIKWKKNSLQTIAFLEQFAEMWKEQERGLFIDGDGVKQLVREIQDGEGNLTNSIEKAGKGSKMGKNIDNFVQPKTNNQNSKFQEQMDFDFESTTGDISFGQLDRNGSMEPINSEIVDEYRVEDGGDGSVDMDNEESEEEIIRKSIEQMQWTDYFKIIDAFNQQNFQYDSKKKNYVLNQKVSNIISTPSSAASKQVARYNILKERVLRNEDFNNDQEMYNPLASIKHMEQNLESHNQNSVSAHMQITPIKNLIGRNGHNFLLLGMIRINDKSQWCLEDPSGSITIDIQQTVPTPGTFYFPGCTVLAEGIYYTVGNKFYVTSMTTPPSERREETLKTIGDLDLLGVHATSTNSFYSRINDDLKLKLHYLNAELTDHRFIFLGGDLFLDKLSTFEALPKLFESLNENPPVAIVFNGSFSSVPIYPSLSSKHNSLSTEYKHNFDSFASLIGQYKNIVNHTNLIFIPGPNDPWGTMVSLGSKTISWPQLPVPSYFTEKMKRICKKSHFVTNPSKIGYLSLELMMVRDDLYERMKRNNISFPALEEDEDILEGIKMSQPVELSNDIVDDIDNENPLEPLPADLQIDKFFKEADQTPVKISEARKIVKTLLDQGHISPFLPSTRPINWDLDHTLHLSPLPSFICLCDTSADIFDVTYNGCKVANPGTFFGSRRKINYIEYIPSIRKAYQQELNF